MDKRITLPEAARRLGISYDSAKYRIMVGNLKGGRDDLGHWWADAIDVAKAVSRQRRQRKTVAS